EARINQTSQFVQPGSYLNFSLEFYDNNIPADAYIYFCWLFYNITAGFSLGTSAEIKQRFNYSALIPESWRCGSELYLYLGFRIGTIYTNITKLVGIIRNYDIWYRAENMNSTNASISVWVGYPDGSPLSGGAVSFSYFRKYATEPYYYNLSSTTNSSGFASFNLTYPQATAFDFTINVSGLNLSQTLTDMLIIDNTGYGYDAFRVEMVSPQYQTIRAGESSTFTFKAYNRSSVFGDGVIYYYARALSRLLGYGQVTTNSSGYFTITETFPERGWFVFLAGTGTGAGGGAGGTIDSDGKDYEKAICEVFVANTGSDAITADSNLSLYAGWNSSTKADVTADLGQQLNCLGGNLTWFPGILSSEDIRDRLASYIPASKHYYDWNPPAVPLVTKVPAKDSHNSSNFNTSLNIPAFFVEEGITLALWAVRDGRIHYSFAYLTTGNLSPIAITPTIVSAGYTNATLSVVLNRSAAVKVIVGTAPGISNIALFTPDYIYNSYQFYIDSLQPGRTYYLTIEAREFDTNNTIVGYGSYITTFRTQNATPQMYPAIVSYSMDTGKTHCLFTLNLSIRAAASVRIRGDSLNTIFQSDSGYSYTHIINATGLKEGSKYNATIIMTSTEGIENITYFEFVTLKTDGKYPVSILNRTEQIESRSATIFVSLSSDASVELQIEGGGNYAEFNSTVKRNHVFIIPSLLPLTSYSYTLIMTEPDGTVNTSGPFFFRTLSQPIEITILNVSIINGTPNSSGTFNTSVRIVWQTGYPANSNLTWGFSYSASDFYTGLLPLATEFNFTITGLKPGQTIFYTIWANYSFIFNKTEVFSLTIPDYTPPSNNTQDKGSQIFLPFNILFVMVLMLVLFGIYLYFSYFRKNENEAKKNRAKTKEIKKETVMEREIKTKKGNGNIE
ncbi:MAG: hypothetical protein QW728_06710, partial [Thermoplasmata archaeon]